MSTSSHTGFHSAIDVGATKVCVVVCRSTGSGVEIVGHGVAANGGTIGPADGTRDAAGGVIAAASTLGGPVATAASSDLAATQSAAREAVAMAERRCQLRIGAAYASIAQARGAGLGVDAGAAQKAAEREALVLGIESAGVSVSDCVPSSIASAEAVLRDEERKAGVALLDIGARTTDIVVYAGGVVTHTEVISFGGATLTAALAERFGISLAEAEFLKRNATSRAPTARAPGSSVRGRRATIRGSSAQLAFPGFYDCEPEPMVAVPNCKHGEGKAIRRSDLELVIESRLERLWSQIRRSLEPHPLPSGIVLTGGATLLQGFVAQAQTKLGRLVRRAEPFGIEGLSGHLHNPAFATGVGLALWAARNPSLRERRPTWGRRRLASA